MNILAQAGPTDEETSPGKIGALSATNDGGATNSLTDWASRILECVARGGAHTLELALLIYSARTALRRGQWSQLCRSGQLHISKRKAEMLAVIGQGLGDINAQTFARLPSGWSILYQIAHLPRPLLITLVADETIHPRLTLAEAKRLRARFQGVIPVDVRLPRMRQRWRHFEQFVQTNSSQWTDTQRHWLMTNIRQLADSLEHRSANHPETATESTVSRRALENIVISPTSNDHL